MGTSFTAFCRAAETYKGTERCKTGFAHGEVVGWSGEDDAIDHREDDDPSQRRSVDEETPEHARIQEHDEWAREDLPDLCVRVAARVQRQRTDVAVLLLVWVRAIASNLARNWRVLNMRPGAVDLLALRSALLILDSSLGKDLAGDLGTDECGLRYEEDDAHAEDAEENSADTESPLVAKILDNVA